MDDTTGTQVMGTLEAARIFARIGGQSTLRIHGKEHFVKIAKERWAKEKKRKEKEIDPQT